MKFTDEKTEETLLRNLSCCFFTTFFFFLKSIRVRRSSLTLKSVFCCFLLLKKSVRIRRCSLTLLGYTVCVADYSDGNWRKEEQSEECLFGNLKSRCRDKTKSVWNPWRSASKHKDLGSISLRLFSLFKSCGLFSYSEFAPHRPPHYLHTRTRTRTLTDLMSTLPNSASVSLAFDTFPAVHACRQAALTADVTPRMQLSSSILVLKMLHSFTEVSPHFSDERKDLHKLPWLPNCLHFLMQPLSPAKTVPVLTSCQRHWFWRLLRRISGRQKMILSRLKSSIEEG